MIRDRLIFKYVRYGWFFRAYSNYCSMRGHLQNSQRNREEDNTTVPGRETVGLASLEEMMQEIKSGGVVCGEDLISDYDNDPEKTILLVTHELSLTGAPIVLFNMALTLKKTGWQPLIISPEDGALGSYAAEHGVPAVYIPDLLQSGVVSEIRDMFAAVITNTIVTAPVVKELDGTDMPVMWWIHESAAAYGRDMAETLPRRMSDNVHIYCAGAYAKDLLTVRRPRYDAETLLFYVRDTSRYNAKDDMCYKEHPNDQKVFACVGTIEPRKGQDILLKAICGLPDKERENSRFIFVGAVIDQKIKKQIVEMQRRSPQQITFYEGLGIDEIYELYTKVDYLICSSRDESMSVVMAESMSLGKPCICSENAGAADIIKQYNAGFTYSNNDPRRLMELIVRAYDLSEEEYRRLGENARLAYEKVFSEEVFEKNLADIMMKLTGNYDHNIMGTE